MSKIKKINALEILDSRGRPTISCIVELSSGHRGQASVPSGASTGSHEAFELRDSRRKKYYHGAGVLQAIDNIQQRIERKLYGTIVTDQQRIDALMCELDGTSEKKQIGANAILAVSMACVRAAAAFEQKPLYEYLRSTYNFERPFHIPVPMSNILNGGRHADNDLSVQECMLVPQKTTIAENLRLVGEVYHELKKYLQNNKYSIGLGDEGGFAPRIATVNIALDMISIAVEQAGYKLGKDVCYALDIAASEFFNNGKYHYQGGEYTATQLLKQYEHLIAQYPIISIEDPFAEDDWEAWIQARRVLPATVRIVGDDLFVTHKTRVEKGVAAQAADAVLIKLNQVGTVTETMDVIHYAKDHGLQVIVSHRSGETTDDFIADLAVACGAAYLKAGAPARGERVVKYNRLLAIEHLLLNRD